MSNAQLNANEIIQAAFARSLRSANPDLVLDHSQAVKLSTVESPRHLPETRSATAKRAAAKRRMEAGLSAILQGLGQIAQAHGELYDSPIGEDGVLGDNWLEIARGLVGMLNGEHGRLCAGAMDSAVRDLAAAVGFTEAERDTI